MGRAIPLTLEQYTTGQLGRPTTNRPVRPQLVAKRNNKKLTIQVTYGKRTKNDMGGKKNDGPSSRRPSPRYTTCLQQGTRLHQTRAAPHGRKGQNQVYALRPRVTCLARRGQSPNPLPYIKTRSKKIRTFSHQKGSIRRIIRARIAGTMEDTSGDPCQPPNTL